MRYALHRNSIFQGGVCRRKDTDRGELGTGYASSVVGSLADWKTTSGSFQGGNMFKRIVFTAFIAFLATHLVYAHSGWIDTRDGELAFIYGHGQKVDPYKPEYVKEAKAVDATGGGLAVEIVRHKDYASLVPKGNPSIITALFDNGYWVKTPDGWKNIGKREAQDKKLSIIRADLSRKYAKAILAPCEAFSKPLGLFFEIVPEKDPLALKSGENLPIKVLLDGKPAEGLAIVVGAEHVDSKDLPKTDIDGKVSITIGSSGLQLLTTEYKLPLTNDPEADFLYVTSSLTFTVK